MADNKTKATKSSVGSYLAAIENPQRRKDCEALAQLMTKASKQDATMWGTAIVGFGTHRYPLSGGRTGEICAVGFSSRKADITIYGVAGEDADASLLEKLGKYDRGKGCLYVSKLDDIDRKVLEKLVAQAIKRKTA